MILRLSTLTCGTTRSALLLALLRHLLLPVSLLRSKVCRSFLSGELWYLVSIGSWRNSLNLAEFALFMSPGWARSQELDQIEVCGNFKSSCWPIAVVETEKWPQLLADMPTCRSPYISMGQWFLEVLSGPERVLASLQMW